MATLEKHNMGRGDYWIYRSEAKTKDALVRDIWALYQEQGLSFPLFVSTMPPGISVSLEFRNEDEMRWFCQGFSFAVK